MQFLTLSQRQTDKFSDADFAPFVEQEAQRARTLYAEGFIRQVWYRGDVRGACLLIEASSEDEVRDKLSTLPLVKAGMVVIVMVVPLTPYGGFGPRT